MGSEDVHSQLGSVFISHPECLQNTAEDSFGHRLSLELVSNLHMMCLTNRKESDYYCASRRLLSSGVTCKSVVLILICLS